MDQHTKNIAVIGLGYVGLPLAIELSKKYNVVGFDEKLQRIEELKKGNDRTKEVSDRLIRNSSVHYTTNSHEIANCSFIVVAVPTPIKKCKTPDLTALFRASKTVGQQLQKGSIVVYESTVYPGATEDDCVPILEKESGLQCGVDFKVGYSPERINPGDVEHTLTNIVKIVSGMDQESLEIITEVYGSIIKAGIFKAKSIKVAEAAKVIENTQRDLNIALMNELATIFEIMNIRTKDVLKAAGTKWNFLNFTPGLVGGHCIGVDPYYLTHKSILLGHNPTMILAGRKINDSIGKMIAEKTVLHITKVKQMVVGAKILILGLTYKENISDIRNTKVLDIVNELNKWDCQVDVFDPFVDQEEAKFEGFQLLDSPRFGVYSAVIMAVGHDFFVEQGPSGLIKYLNIKNDFGVFIDVRSIFQNEDFPKNVLYWSL